MSDSRRRVPVCRPHAQLTTRNSVLPPRAPPPCRRQEKLERELERYHIRHGPIGLDRHHRRYYWGMGGLRSVVLCEAAEGVWSAITAPQQLDMLIASLDPRVGAERRKRGSDGD